MKRTLKHTLPLLLVLCTLLLFTASPYRVKAEQRAMMYNNVITATMDATCSSSGHVEIEIDYKRKTNVTASATIETYIEKRGFLGIFWTRVDIEPANDVWVDTTTASSLYPTHEHDLVSTGTYRVKTRFTVSGTGGADDIIDVTQEIVY